MAYTRTVTFPPVVQTIADYTTCPVKFISATEARVLLQYDTGSTEVVIDLTSVDSTTLTKLAAVLDTIRKRALAQMNFV